MDFTMPNFYHNSVIFASQLIHTFDLVKCIAKGGRLKKLASPINRVMSDLQYNSYQFIIHSFTGQYYSQTEAKRIWLSILAHHADMIILLERDPGIVVASLDYFENVNKTPNHNYIFIEKNELHHLLEMSLLDGLTQVYNRTTFILLMDKEIQLVKRHHEPAALLMIDIDNFKLINDQNGHQHGDQALLSCANIIKEAIRAMDIAGRYGGDEFIVFLPSTNKNDALIIAERIKENISIELSIYNTIGRPSERVTVSIGASLFPKDGETFSELVCTADAALYKAKEKGKNMVIHSPTNSFKSALEGS
jgi:diguanylate cyclase (GGDEF)-like protein